MKKLNILMLVSSILVSNSVIAEENLCYEFKKISNINNSVNYSSSFCVSLLNTTAMVSVSTTEDTLDPEKKLKSFNSLDIKLIEYSKGYGIIDINYNSNSIKNLDNNRSSLTEFSFEISLSISSLQKEYTVLENSEYTVKLTKIN